MGRMNRREFVKRVVPLGLAAAGGRAFAQQPAPVAAAPAPARADGPSVLLLLTDDQSYHLSCLGTPGIRTPHVDGLAAEGVLFTRAYATCSSCSPSRSSILTGMCPHSHGHWRNTVTPAITEPASQFGRESTKLDPVGVHEDLPTLVEILGQHGYVTGITQKFHLSPPWKYPFQVRLGTSHVPETNRAAARQFLTECGARPFFFMANIGNTHRPFRRGKGELTGPPVDPEAIAAPPYLADTPAMRRDLADYFAAVQGADACVGAVLDALRETGRYEDTLIVFTSDNGYCYHRAKASVYEDGVHMPLIVRGPGVAGGRRLRDLMSHVDLVPTILDALGIPVPPNVQGRSLGPLLEGRPDAAGPGGAGSGRDVVFSEHNAHGPGEPSLYPSRAVTDGRLRYIRNLRPEKTYVLPADAMDADPWGNGSYQATLDARDEFPVQYDLLQRTLHRPAEELYDLHTDPGEIVNLVEDARYAGPLARLRAALDEWMRVTEDPGDPTRIVRRQ